MPMELSLRTSTFVSIDVVGSTQLKSGQREEDVLHTFMAYHHFISDLTRTYQGEVINISGDGLMCRFKTPEQAASMAEAVLLELTLFNKSHNRLSHSLRLRLGIHTGDVHEMQGVSSGQWISPTLDRAAKLQEGALPDSIRISEATYRLLGEAQHTYANSQWDALLQMNTYTSKTAKGPGAAAATLPQKPRFMVITEDLAHLACIGEALKNRTEDLWVAFNAAQAQLVMPSYRPHVLLIDLDLPWDDGWKMLMGLRMSAEWSSMPILVFSERSDGDHLEKCFQKGANGFIAKPLDEAPFLKRLDVTLREFFH